MILHSQIIGEGTPLLILHGYFGMSDNWRTLGKKFADNNFQVHLIDQRNHGRSFHAYEFNYNVLAEDLHNYIKHHNLEDVILLGHSMGGKTAMFYASKYANLVNRLIVVDISTKGYEPHHNAILAGLNSVDFSVQNSRKLVDEQLSKFIPELGVRQFLMKNVFWVEKGKLGFRFNLKSLTENNSKVGEAVPKGQVYNGDTLFIKGEKSGYILDNESLLISPHFPSHSIKTIKDAGHWVHAENPIAFYDSVITFIK